ncbi:MAG TPA: YtxH domain-containing protein [Chitinophagales bacterium]|jgi:gas vesicle protein|nr:YtxH domain-containing protein [Chitinophagales bacterium]
MENGKVLLGVLAGVAVGATLGILFAPDSGTNTRKKIMKKGEDYAGNLKDQYNHLAESLSEEVDGFKNEINHLVSNGKAKFEQEKSSANNVRSEVSKAIN